MGRGGEKGKEGFEEVFERGCEWDAKVDACPQSSCSCAAESCK